jgi:hypothetical protein
MFRSKEQKRLDKYRRAARKSRQVRVEDVLVDSHSARNILHALGRLSEARKKKLLRMPVRQTVVASNRIAFEDNAQHHH